MRGPPSLGCRVQHGTKLNREVAIQVLPDSFAADPDRLAASPCEAQVLASLNHPNIAIIHGVEDRAIVMQLVEGHTPAGRSQMCARKEAWLHRDHKPAKIATR